MAEQSPAGNERGRGQGIVTWSLIVVVVLPFAYVLSMGPLLWLANHGYLPIGVRRFLSNVYAPLWVVASYLRPLKDFLHWYMSLWN